MKHRRRAFSIHQMLLAFFAVLGIFLITGLTYMASRSEWTILRQTAQTEHSSLRIRLLDIDRSLEELDVYMYDLMTSNADAATLDRDAGEIERFQARASIASELERIVALNRLIDGVWFYSPRGSEAELLTRNVSNRIDLAGLDTLRGIILEMASGQGDEPINDWIVVGEAPQYLFRIIRVGDAWCGAWISMENLLESFSRTELSATSATYAFLTPGGDSVYPVGARIPLAAEAEKSGVSVFRDRSVTLSIPMQQSDLVAAVHIPSRAMQPGDDGIFQYVGLTALLILLMLGMFAGFQYLLTRPILCLSEDIQGVRRGHLEQRVRDDSRVLEIDMLGKTINQLLDEVNTLRIGIYEEQLTKQKTECQYLQIQLKTHFYMNCLNIIHTLAQVGNTKLISEMTLYLVRYFRFISRNGAQFICLEDELEHLRDYLHIQELRFPNVFRFEEDVDPDLLTERIPPLVLETFVENSILHALDSSRMNVVRLRVSYEEREEQPGMRVVIADNGAGFSAEQLAFYNDVRFARGEPVASAGTKGIGIVNVLCRLALLYKGRAEARFADLDTGGAQISIWLPALCEVEEENVQHTVRR